MQVIITDSNGMPRGNIASLETRYEETFPYMVSKKLNFNKFYQQSMGGTTTPSLIDRFSSYFSHCEPEIIIVQAGIVDCTPRSLGNYEHEVLKVFSRSICDKIKNNKYLAEKRNVRYVTKKKFKQSITKLSLIFDEAKIFWILPIIDYETSSSSMKMNHEKYCNIIKKIFPDTYLDLNEDFNLNNGLMPDKIHYSKKGHHIITKKICNKINTY